MQLPGLAAAAKEQRARHDAPSLADRAIRRRVPDSRRSTAPCDRPAGAGRGRGRPTSAADRHPTASVSAAARFRVRCRRIRRPACVARPTDPVVDAGVTRTRRPSELRQRRIERRGRRPDARPRRPRAPARCSAPRPISGAEDVDRAYAAAATAFETWRDTTPSERQQALLKFADAIEEPRRGDHRRRVRRTPASRSS